MADDTGKISQQQANYRAGSPLKNCGLCQHFTGSESSEPYACTRVAGEISPFGFSDEYGKQDNPFRENDEDHRYAMQGGNVVPRNAPQTVRIGNRSY
jgi:hypothetical protein